jgi:NADP-dependent 3-hydroxy acid dehydrogenase YdfG
MHIFKPINIFITGASSGIGNALAHEYAKRCSHKNVPADRIDIGLQGIDSKHVNVNIGLVARRSEHLQQLA